MLAPALLDRLPPPALRRLGARLGLPADVGEARLVARLCRQGGDPRGCAAILSALRVPEVRELLRWLELPRAGAKAALVARLVERGPGSAIYRAAPPAPGEVLEGRWQLGPLLGEGGFGSAFRCTDLRLPQRLLVAKLAHDPQDRSLENEFFRTQNLSHPHVVRSFDLGREERGGRPYLVLEHAGTSLETRCEREGARPLPEALELLRQLAPTLDFLHARGLAHGDLNPGNLLWCETAERWRLADFGLAQGLSDPAAACAGYHPHFSAPEARSGRLLAASDQFSLALLFLAALCGAPQLEPEPAALTLPARWALARARAPDPSQRFPTCAAFARTLEAGLARRLRVLRGGRAA